jgi:ABC-type branched-subunit amino acid transport system ATPase component
MSRDVNAALSVDEVVIRYGSTTAVDRATFNLARGRLLALLGPNGAGSRACYRSVRATGDRTTVG